jgi:hypothetical protein
MIITVFTKRLVLIKFDFIKFLIIKMKVSLLSNRLLCEVNSASNALLLVIFVISFLIFRFYSIKNKKSEEEINRRKKKAEKYMNKYKHENEEFFMPEVD